MDVFIEVLKWAGIVLAAGFVGYFGRYLAMVIIERAQKKRLHPPRTPAKELPSAPEPPPETPLAPEVQLEEARLKIEKKKAKAEAKALKKAEKK